jgi:Flp pilus assembly protein TadD
MALLLFFSVGCSDPARRSAGHLERARASYSEQDLETARLELLNAIKLDPSSADAYLLMGHVLLRLRSFNGAYAAYTTAYELAPGDRDVALGMARFLTSVGGYERSLEILEKWLADNSRDTSAWSLVSKNQLRLGSPEKALTAALKVTSLSPESPGSWAGLAGVHMVRKDRDAAMAAVTRARNLDPPLLSAEMIYSDLLIMQGEMAAAVSHLKETEKIFQARPEIPIRRASLLARLGRTREAENTYLEVVERFPDHLLAYTRLVELYAADKRLLELAEHMGRSIKAGEAKAQRLVLLGMIQDARGDVPSAIKAYRLALKEDPDLVPVLNNLAWDLAGEEELTEALRLATRARELAGDDPLVADTLGWIMHKSGQPESALVLLREALEGSPGHPEIRKHLVTVLRSMDRTEEAVRVEGGFWP